VGTLDLIADVAGFYLPGEGIAFHPIDPVRVADTRTSAPARPDSPLPLFLRDVIPVSASAVLLNVTATEATAATHVSVVPGSGSHVAESSALNVAPGATVPNLAAVMSGMQGSLVLKPGAGSVHLVVDLSGYFAPVPSTCATAGCVHAWGQSNNGMLGSGGGSGQVGSYYGEAQPRPVSGLSGVTAVVGRYALKADGTVRAWGENYYGQLGAGWHGSGGFAPVPVRVRGLSDVTALASSNSNGYALRSDGTVWGWGHNYSGQVGPITTPDRVVDLPTRIQGVDDVTAIATSQGTAYALRSDGTLWSWGENIYADLGNGTIGGSSPTPAPVVGLTDVVGIAAAANSRYALRSDGTVWTWGINSEGQFGNGTTTGMSGTPAQVPSLTGVVSVAASYATGYAVLPDRTVVAWGSNDHGQAGVGHVGGRYVTQPRPVLGLTEVEEIVGAGGNAYAVRADGSLWGWGLSVWYQLGVPSSSSVYSPQRIPGLPPVVAGVATTGSGAYAILG
jgi:alpha-tubulin suppressor-like RCC1 family protein